MGVFFNKSAPLEGVEEQAGAFFVVEQGDAAVAYLGFFLEIAAEQGGTVALPGVPTLRAQLDRHIAHPLFVALNDLAEQALGLAGIPAGLLRQVQQFINLFQQEGAATGFAQNEMRAFAGIRVVAQIVAAGGTVQRHEIEGGRPQADGPFRAGDANRVGIPEVGLVGIARLQVDGPLHPTLRGLPVEGKPPVTIQRGLQAPFLRGRIDDASIHPPQGI